MSGCLDCSNDKKCNWWCPVCQKHHVVQSMVEDCIEVATSPDA